MGAAELSVAFGWIRAFLLPVSPAFRPRADFAGAAGRVARLHFCPCWCFCAAPFFSSESGVREVKGNPQALPAGSIPQAGSLSPAVEASRGFYRCWLYLVGERGRSTFTSSSLLQKFLRVFKLVTWGSSV